MELRDDFLEDLHTLSCEVCAQKVHARKSASWFRERLHESDGDRIRPCAEHDRDARCRASCRYGDGGGNCIYQGDLLLLQTPRCLLDRFGITSRIANVQSKLFPLHKPTLPQTLPQPIDDGVPRPTLQDDTDAGNSGLLGLGSGEGDQQRNGDYDDKQFLIHRFALASERMLAAASHSRKCTIHFLPPNGRGEQPAASECRASGPVLLRSWAAPSMHRWWSPAISQ